VVINAVADQRYELFQSAASSIGNSEWKCDSMENLINKII